MSKRPISKFHKVMEDIATGDFTRDVVPTRFSIRDDSRALLVYGDNASGKSFLARVLSSSLHSAFGDKSGEFITMNLSMNKRTGGDFAPSFVRSMMFGSEAERSTGQISARIIQMGFKTAAESDYPHLLIFDEPDIGLSESYHRAIGDFMAENINRLSDKTVGVVVVTHARKIAQQLYEKCNPSLANVAYRPDLFQDVREWIEKGAPDRSLDEFLALQEIARKRRIAINHYLNKKKTSRRSPSEKPDLDIAPGPS